MSIFLKHLSMWNMLAQVQVQIQKYKTHAYKIIYKTPKTACVQTIIFLSCSNIQLSSKDG